MKRKQPNPPSNFHLYMPFSVQLSAPIPFLQYKNAPPAFTGGAIDPYDQNFRLFTLMEGPMVLLM